MATMIRAKSQDTLVFTLTQGGVAYDLSSATKVALHRIDNHGTWDSIDTVANPTELAVTDATAGEVTLTPLVTYWGTAASGYSAYLEVTVGGKCYTFPNGGSTSGKVEYIEFVILKHKP